MFGFEKLVPDAKDEARNAEESYNWNKCSYIAQKTLMVSRPPKIK
jgi:hypothetical protein